MYPTELYISVNDNNTSYYLKGKYVVLTSRGSEIEIFKNITTIFINHYRYILGVIFNITYDFNRVELGAICLQYYIEINLIFMRNIQYDI